MDGQLSLLNKSEKIEGKLPNKQYLSPNMTPIFRYNLCIDCYNTPCNKVNAIELHRLPSPKIYDLIFKISTNICGKIIFIILCALPFLNIIPLISSIIFAYTFWNCLQIHHKNQVKVHDPFIKMKFDQEMCRKMRCDYYFFTIELKELEGFSLNYQENASERLRLRKQRGPTHKMVYSSNFWGSYQYFDKWKIYHYLPLIVSLTLFIAINLLCILLIALSGKSNS